MELKSDDPKEQQARVVSEIETKKIRNTLIWLIILNILILALLLYTSIYRHSYTSLGNFFYIDDRTGEVHNALREYDDNKRSQH